ncbi:hypothetical protein CDAR_584451, partial [Caerostris darwini]
TGGTGPRPWYSINKHILCPLSGRGSPLPVTEDSEKMDLSLQRDEEKRLNETTPVSDNTANVPPPEVTDEFLYDHVNDIIEIIDIKSKLIVDWFRPTECLTNPELCQQYEQTYLQHQEQLMLKCKNLGISHNEIPVTIVDLKDRIEHLHLAKQMAAAAPNTEHQHQTPPAPPKRRERYASNHAFSSSALELFRTLSVLAHDETLNFQILLKAIRTALPTLRTLDNDEEKSITIFEHYYAHYNGQQI